MSKDEKRVPELRFKGFTEDWHQRKLSEYLNVSKQKNKEESFGKKDVLSVSGDYGIVNQIEFQGRSFAGKSVANYGVVDTGDVVYTKSPLKSNPYGIIKTNKGKAGIVSTLYAVYKPKQKVDPEFVQIYFEQDTRMNNYMHPLVNKGAKNDMKVSAENALKGEVYFPSTKEEQQKISELFWKIDHLITLHQRKLEQLKLLKKAYLQQMFPQNGEKMPRLRFTNFDGEWQERKFTSFVNRLNKTSNSNYLPKVEFADIVAGEGRLNKDIRNKFDDRKGILFNANNILYGKLRPYLKNWLFSDFKGIALGDFWVFEAKNSVAKYIYYLIQADAYQRVANDTSGTKMPRSNWKQVSNTIFLIPDEEEQFKIGEIFSYLDKTISIQQKRIDHLKQLKSAYLQKMFV